MCGVAGFVNLENKSFYGKEIEFVLGKQVQALKHRGPDDSGIWVNESRKVGLCHTRLSIQDLSANGAQPMVSNSGRFILVFNGEIYNHLVLRKELEPRLTSKWKGNSDTETLLKGFECWGIRNTIIKTKGMFGFAVFDKKEEVLTLGRDRFGEKPLYFSFQNGIFMFSSELKALKHNPFFDRTIDRRSLLNYLRKSYISAPSTIYQKTSKLCPGSLMQIKLGANPKISNPEKFWNIEKCFLNQSNRVIKDDDEIIGIIEKQLLSIVSSQMLSDRPIGAFLSGGIDSSMITAMMQANSGLPVKTFTIGFEESEFDEANYAKKISSHLGTMHTEVYISEKDAMNIIPDLPEIYDEPFSDASQIPTLLLSRVASAHVSVALSGDAGDELFFGYNRYHFAAKYWKYIKALPYALRKCMSSSIDASIPFLNFIRSTSFIPIFNLNSLAKVQKIGAVFNSKDIHQYYDFVTDKWSFADELLRGDCSSNDLFNSSITNFENEVSELMLTDYKTYLPDDILCKVDRASMSTSLETRIPFLDHELVDFVTRLPLHMKFRNNDGKWLLRQILFKYVPKELIERPKMGFSVPIAKWLRGPLRDWAESLIGEQKVKSEGFFHHEKIKRKWNEHLRGNRDWSDQLWSILMFQAWLENEKIEA